MGSFTNYIGDIIIVAILIIAMMIGMHRGFMAMIVGVVGGLLVLVLASILCAPFANLLNGSFGLGAKLSQAYSKAFDFSAEIYSVPVKELTPEQISEVVGGMGLPQFVVTPVVKYVLEAIASTTLPETATLQILVLDMFGDITVKVISWVILAIVLFIIFAIIKKLAKGINKVPVIGTLNRLLGVILSGVVAAFFICLAMYLFILLGGIISSSVINYVENSFILKWLYENNPFGYLLNLIFVK